MPFKKGQSGNPAGRPPLLDSLSEQIRAAFTPDQRSKCFARMMDIACEPHGDPKARIGAAEWLAKHGWPTEGAGKTTIATDKLGNTTVTHEHLA